MDAHLERAGRRGERRERADQIVRQHGLRELVHRRDCVAGRGGIGRIRFDEQRRALSAHQPPREIGGDGQHELRGPGREHAVGLVLVRGFADEREIVAVLQAGEDAAREFAAIGAQDGRGQMLRIGIDGESEQDQLDDGNADDHAEGQAIALELDELLADDAEPARE